MYIFVCCQDIDLSYGQLQTEIGNTEKAHQAASRAVEAEKERLRKDKEKHEALRKQLEQQRIK